MRVAEGGVLVAAAAVWMTACGDERPPAEGSLPSASSSSGGGLIAKPSAADACSAPTKLVYVISSQYDLLSFTPNTGTFARIGRVRCPGVSHPNSMALDRYGTAWVNYADGRLMKVSTADASCEETSFAPGQLGVGRFGMAFASDTARGENETLFINGVDDDKTRNFGLARIDTSSLGLTRVGDFSGRLLRESAELTGTGDARLFGFFTTSPNATFAEIDPITGATTNERELTGVSTGNAWAFSFWGGDFWFYSAQASDAASTVTRLALSGDGSLGAVKTNADLVVSTSGQPFHIVGAGVSTCAPLEPPK